MGPLVRFQLKLLRLTQITVAKMGKDGCVTLTLQVLVVDVKRKPESVFSVLSQSEEGLVASKVANVDGRADGELVQSWLVDAEDRLLFEHCIVFCSSQHRLGLVRKLEILDRALDLLDGGWK